MGRVGVGVGDMTKAVYDPDLDGLIALAQLVAAVCSEIEAAGLITAHAGVATAHHTPPTPGIWILAETLSPSGVATITSSTLAVHDLWMVALTLTLTKDSETQLRLQLNEDTGSNYVCRYADNTTLVVATSTTFMRLGSSYDNEPLMGVFYVGGKSLGVTGNVLVSGGVAGSNAFDYLLNGRYSASADITKFTFSVSGETMTGKIKLFYMDY